jgi:hypothetical protein
MPPTDAVPTSAEIEHLRRRVDELDAGLAALRNALQPRGAQGGATTVVGGALGRIGRRSRVRGNGRPRAAVAQG